MITSVVLCTSQNNMQTTATIGTKNKPTNFTNIHVPEWLWIYPLLCVRLQQIVALTNISCQPFWICQSFKQLCQKFWKSSFLNRFFLFLNFCLHLGFIDTAQMVFCALAKVKCWLTEMHILVWPFCLKNCMLAFTYLVCLHVFAKGVGGWTCAYLARG